MLKKALYIAVTTIALAATPAFADGLWDKIEGNWKQVVGEVKQQWADLTDDATLSMSGKRDELVGAIQEQYGIAQEEAEKQVDEWAESLDLE